MVRRKKRETFVLDKIHDEIEQSHATRRGLYEQLESVWGMPVVYFATSFSYPVMIEEEDAETLEAILRECDLSKGLVLLLSSPGGDIVAAEKIVNICRSYSGTGEYWAVVPQQAKSAATMICLGASRVLMSPTSEMGPIDPQIMTSEDGERKVFSVNDLISSYDDLFGRATRETGHIEPYLQQLDRYDEREIVKMRRVCQLTADLAVGILKTGMMQSKSKEQIRAMISGLLSPDVTKTHDRPIRLADAEKLGLIVERIDLRDTTWSLVYELWARMDFYVSNQDTAKCIECKEHSFVTEFEEGEEEEEEDVE